MSSGSLSNEKRRLEELRRKNSELTSQIFELVGGRLSIVKEIASLKRILGEEAENPRVEQELRNRILEESSRLKVDPDFASRLLSLILEESVKSQKTTSQSSVMTIFTRAKELEQKGEKILHLEVGEPDLPPPSKVIDELTIAAKNGRTQYTSPKGVPVLSEAITSRLRREGLDVSSRCVLPTPGSKFGMYLAFSALCPLGSEVIQITPAWSGYQDTATAARLRCVSLKTTLEEEWVPDVNKLAELISPSTRMVIMNYPNNPTGRILPSHNVDEIVKLVRDRNLTLISDEVYLDYAYAPCESLATYPDCKKVVLRSFSKQFSMTGFRLGYVISDEDSTSKMMKMLGMHMTSIPEFIQYAGVKAFEEENLIRRNSKIIEDRLKSAVKVVQKLPLEFLPPQGSFYIFARLPRRHSNGNELTSRLLEEGKVAVAPGQAFGDYPDHIRLSYCQDESIFQEAVSRISEFLK